VDRYEGSILHCSIQNFFLHFFTVRGSTVVGIGDWWIAMRVRFSTVAFSQSQKWAPKKINLAWHGTLSSCLCFGRGGV